MPPLALSPLIGLKHPHPELRHVAVALQPRRASPEYQTKVVPASLRASKATPAYPDSQATSQTPNAVSEATPAYRDPTATSQG